MGVSPKHVLTPATLKNRSRSPIFKVPPEPHMVNTSCKNDCPTTIFKKSRTCTSKSAITRHVTLTLTSGQRWTHETLVLYKGTLCAQYHFSRPNHLHTDGHCPFRKQMPLATPKVGQSHAWPILANHGHKAHHMHTFGSFKISFLSEIAKWAFGQNTFWHNFEVIFWP